MIPRSRNVLFLLLFSVSIPLLLAQDIWHKETMRGLDSVPLTTLRGIGIPAEAEYKGHIIKAYVFFSGYDGHAGGRGYPVLGIHVEDIEKYIPEAEMLKFMGPDLSQYAMQNDAIQLSVRQGGINKKISTRLLFSDGKDFDPGFDTVGFFETNPRKTKFATDAWMRFLALMSDGFEEGKVVIGGKAFSGELTVRFSGNGLGAQLKELMAYCNKQ